MTDKVELPIFDSENTGYQRHIAIRQFIYEQVILKPPEWLEGLESPFKWGLDIEIVELVSWNIPEKLSDYNNQGAFYGFEKFAFLLTMLFRKTCSKEWKKVKFVRKTESDTSEEDGSASEEEEEIDEYEPERAYAICREVLNEMAANEGDTMYSRIGPALQHVLQATRAHMLCINGNIAESQELARNIQPVEEMSQECKAGFEGLKAKVIMSMYQSYKIVLPYLHKAMELDPGFGYWPYLIGKVLRRARREFKEGVIEEELKYFEKAVALERNPKFLVFLGQAYQEMAQAIIYSRQPRESADSFLQKAVELYSECWQLKNDSAAIARRVGNGMMKMRAGFINKTVAKEALLKAVELSVNDCTCISLGKFYYIHEKDDEKAIEQFLHCHPGLFGTSEIIRLNLIKDPNYDPHDLLKALVEPVEAAQTVKEYKVFCEAAWYYLVFKGDLETSVKYIWKVLAKDNKSIRATTALEYRSYTFCLENPVNLIEVLVNEILLLKERNESLPPEEKKDLKLLQNYLKKILKKYPELGNITPRPNLLQNLKREVELNIANKRNRRYGQGQSRGRVTVTRSVEEPGSWRNSRSTASSEENNTGQHSYDDNRGYNQWYSSTSRVNTNRNDEQNRHSFSLGDDERRNRRYNRDDHRSNSESQSNWSNPRTSKPREEASNQSDANRRFNFGNRGRIDRQSNSFSNNRYDITITDWRSENRRQ